ncbi:hypothetical protein WOLCODRAFT_139742 [Wolfiporia cocos MD-104 SS10]|uniref:Signal peptidase complex subunit 2 n=1 Tax=Wolfiporia cocos (strain MD-104) TaxID=742152 RepID=A0A2H3J5R3_WOLCO|nr:hypothetical protein WOLCODRAFT_139742 [Wolfiporia cocos MD-104 SS10]
MAPRNRKTNKGDLSPARSTERRATGATEQNGGSESESAIQSALPPMGDYEREEVKVNTASATEMKHACDDALKRFLSRPELFKQIHTHTDVRLALGWLSVFVAAGTGLYGWKVDFEQSKPVVWAGVILYLVLTTLQTLYAYFIEGDIIFVGKRKTFDKRIVTERITVNSTSTPSTPTSPPAYALSASFVRSTSGGKSLLGRARARSERGFHTFFDEHGIMDQEAFEHWVGELVARVMVGKGE